MARNVLKEIGYDDEAKKEWIIKHVKLKLSWIVNQVILLLEQMKKLVEQEIKVLCLVMRQKKQKGICPLAISIAHHLVRYASTLRHDGTFKWARPDMKAQVTIDYTDENQ